MRNEHPYNTHWNFAHRRRGKSSPLDKWLLLVALWHGHHRRVLRVWKCLADSSQFRLSRLDSCHLAKQPQDMLAGCLASELTCIKEYALNMKKRNLSTDIGDLNMTPAQIRIRKTLKKDVSLSLRPVLSLTWSIHDLPSKDFKTTWHFLKSRASHQISKELPSTEPLDGNLDIVAFHTPIGGRVNKTHWTEKWCLK